MNKPLTDRIIGYERIYQDVVERFGDDNAFRFFNHHREIVLRPLGLSLVQQMVDYMLMAKSANRVSTRDLFYAQAMAFAQAATEVLGVPVPTVEEEDEGYLDLDLLNVAHTAYMGDFTITPPAIVATVMEAVDTVKTHGLQKEEV